jgi:hypothetical protein
MCFAPADEKDFFDELGSGAFDAKAVCSDIDAMKAMASVEEDKTMISGGEGAPITRRCANRRASAGV